MSAAIPTAAVPCMSPRLLSLSSIICDAPMLQRRRSRDSASVRAQNIAAIELLIWRGSGPFWTGNSPDKSLSLDANGSDFLRFPEGRAYLWFVGGYHSHDAPRSAQGPLRRFNRRTTISRHRNVRERSTPLPTWKAHEIAAHHRSQPRLGGLPDCVKLAMRGLV